MLQHYSAVPHSACRKPVYLQSLHWENVDHPPLILTLRLWTIISWGCLTTDAKIDSSVMRNCKWLFIDVANARARFLPAADFLTRPKMRQIHHSARLLCIKMMILYWNKWATFNIVMTTHLIAMTYGILITDHFSEVAISKNVMTISVSTSHPLVTVCFTSCVYVCVWLSKRAEFVSQKVDHTCVSNGRCVQVL
jgi:hypothetical protein